MIWLRSGIYLAFFFSGVAACLKFMPQPWCWLWLMSAIGTALFLHFEKRRLREPLKLVCINLIPILFFLACAEWFFARLDVNVENKLEAPVVGWDALLGSAPVAGSRSRFQISHDGEKIADGVITIDQFGNRVTPAFPATTEGATVFYGCSFTFGLGISDRETLPWQFAEVTGRPVYNLALNGYGPQQLLALLESGRFFDRVRQSPKLVIYLALPCHLERLGGEPAFCASSPRYLLRDGEFRRCGTFLPLDGVPVLSMLTRQFFKSSVFARVYSALRRSGADEDERRALFRAALLRMNDLLKRQVPNARFVVLDYDSPTTVVSEVLANAGIEVIRCSGLLEKPLDSPEYRIPHDGHPTGRLWHDMLPALVRMLESGT